MAFGLSLGLAGNAFAQRERAEQLPPRTAMSVDLLDEFDGIELIPWNVLRPDDSHASLTAHPGQLTITTQCGSIAGDTVTDPRAQGRFPKNIYLVDNPLDDDIDFQIETVVAGFDPVEYFQQAGIILYNDDDSLRPFRQPSGVASTSLELPVVAKHPGFGKLVA